MAEGLARTYAGVREKGTEIRKKMAKAGGFLKYGPMLVIILAVISGAFRLKDEGTILDTNTSTTTIRPQQNAPSVARLQPQQEVRRYSVTDCGPPEQLRIKTTQPVLVVGRLGCRMKWDRQAIGGVIKVKINKDPSTERDWGVTTGNTNYGNTPVNLVEFRLSENGTPVGVLVEFIPAKAR